LLSDSKEETLAKMGKLIWILFVAFCLVNIEAKKAEKKVEKAAEEPAAAAPEDANAEDDADDSDDEAKLTKQADAAKATEEEPKAEDSQDEAAEAKDSDAAPKESESEAESSEEDSSDAAEAEETSEEAPEEKSPEFACNLKFKRVGCYADKSKKEKPLRSFIMTDADLGTTSKKGKLPKGDKFNSELPKFACKCANDAIASGNAIFGIQNIAECWTGPDDSKYDKDGESQDCVSFDYAPCDANSVMCAGKKHANFVYYVDTPEHTKSKEEIQREYASYKKKVAAHEKKKSLKKKSAKKLKKKSKKSKKE